MYVCVSIKQKSDLIRFLRWLIKTFWGLGGLEQVCIEVIMGPREKKNTVARYRVVMDV